MILPSVADNLEAVRLRIAAAAARARRPAVSVRLLAVTKHVEPGPILAAAAAGQRLFGENRVQEREAKAAALAAVDDAEWHLIGPLQSNKAARALRLFTTIATVDSSALARRLERLAAAAGLRPAVMIEVNLAAEPQKAGVAPAALAGLVDDLRACSHLRLTGLLAVPPAGPPESSRRWFAALAEARARLLAAGESWELSMGMSHDFEVAIEEGATIVRVGTAIFGQR